MESKFVLDMKTSGLARKIDKQGFLRSKVRIARVGIQEYADGRIYRSPIELIKSIPTFNDQVVTLNHSGWVNSENSKEHVVGFLTSVRYRDGWLEGQLVVTDAVAIQSILDGNTTEFSCGYTADVVRTKGKYLGDEYDAVFKNVVGNHIALVDEARAGSGATFTDGFSKEIIIISDTKLNNIEKNMDTNKANAEEQVVATTEVTDAGITTPVMQQTSNEISITGGGSVPEGLNGSEAVAAVQPTIETQIENLMSMVASLKSQLEALKSEDVEFAMDSKDSTEEIKDSKDIVIDRLEAEKDALEAKLNQQAASKVVYDGKEIADRVAIWSFVKDSKHNSIEVDYSLSVPSVKRLYLTKELPKLSTKIADGSDSYINGLWDAYVNVDNSKDAVVEVGTKLDTPIADSKSALEIAQQAYIERLRKNRG